ncbi:hypothetical protein HK098_003865 [Nowakowskiella sp. JEL0407]|nr:hypothetical protein HK098_003865 [Nowakowskiella sp. JEL0407]
MKSFAPLVIVLLGFATHVQCQLNSTYSPQCALALEGIGALINSNCSTIPVTSDINAYTESLYKSLCTDPKCYNAFSYFGPTISQNCPADAPQIIALSPYLKPRTQAEVDNTATCYKENGKYCSFELTKALSKNETNYCTICTRNLFNKFDKLPGSGLVGSTESEKQINATKAIITLTCGKDFFSGGGSGSSTASVSSSAILQSMNFGYLSSVVVVLISSFAML